MTNDAIISCLNGLIATCKDGENGYRKATEDVHDAQMKNSFLSSSQQCAAAARELQELVREHGGLPEHSGSLMGAIHRGWVDIRSVLAGRDDHAILAEVERGEEAARQNYADALKQELPDEVRLVVLRQYEGVSANSEHAREMREQHASHAGH